ncbi:MAG: hypothetical protein KY429_11235 [Actinobacteria bacterium]|nr:hypothetical protein [Actinomycetota bacterium]
MLKTLASHNEWANRRIFDACSNIGRTQLKEIPAGYSAEDFGFLHSDSVVGILEHLVQAEHIYFELAHGREPRRIRTEDLEELRDECALTDRAYVEYVGGLAPITATTERFLVPWLDFEITLAEGVLHALTHSHKHRADVSMLLPSLGGDGIEMDLLQWITEQRSGE